MSATATRPPRPRGPGRSMLVLALFLLAIAALVAANHKAPLRAPRQRPAATPAGDPFAYRAGRDSRYAARAIAGEAHALFSESPGGALATAARVARLRPLINAAAAGSGVDPDLLEGLVFVESAGRADAIAGNDPAGAAGLTQILPATATSLLGLQVDVPQSTRLTAAIERAQGNGASAAAIGALERRRARIDQRFDPTRALDGAVRYLDLARARFGREDLAFVSYHMGMGNLARVLGAYDGGTAVPYTQLYFDSAPARHAAAYVLLAGFSDQSSLYLWRILGAAAIMRLYRTDRAALARMAALQTGSDDARLVLHPPGHPPGFADPAAVESAYANGTLRALPSNPAALGLAYTNGIGALARSLHAPAGLYRGLRPAALNLLLVLSGSVRSLCHRAPLALTAAVSDARYQQQVGAPDPPAEAGWSFTLARRYVSGAQAQALQAVLDRLQALNLIAWTRYGATIEVTAAGDAAAVLSDGP